MCVGKVTPPCTSVCLSFELGTSPSESHICIINGLGTPTISGYRWVIIEVNPKHVDYQQPILPAALDFLSFIFILILIAKASPIFFPLVFSETCCKLWYYTSVCLYASPFFSVPTFFWTSR